MRNFRFLIIVLAVFKLSVIHSQELNCTVNVNLMANTTSINPSVFKNLQRSIQEFMNNRRWTEETYSQNQKIRATITINIMDASKENVYKADMTVQSERPVFNSTYSSPQLRHIDKSIPFEYIENQPLDYSDQNFFSNLTSILAFYAHLIIAMDQETFSPKGGQVELEKCQTIANNVPANHMMKGELATGWQASEAQDIKGQRTRIGFLLAYMNSREDDFRNAVYKYHLEGLDLMEENPTKAKDNIEAAIEAINKSDNNHYIYKQFVGAKAEEIMNVFKDAAPSKRTKIREILTKIEPTVSERIR